jgi:hypothetical protein
MHIYPVPRTCQSAIVLKSSLFIASIRMPLRGLE